MSLKNKQFEFNGSKQSKLLWLITLVVFLLLSKLAFWQWQRAAEKAELLAQLAETQRQSLGLDALAGSHIDKLDGVSVVEKVRWLKPTLYLLDNQVVQGKLGYDVVLPVQAEDGTGPVVLVNLGWVPAPADRAQLPQIELPEVFDLSGMLRLHPGGFLVGPNIEQTAHFPQRIQSIRVQELATLSHLPLPDLVIYQQQSAFVHHYQAVTLPPERHRAYAVQWALLALAAIAVGWVLNKPREAL